MLLTCKRLRSRTCPGQVRLRMGATFSSANAPLPKIKGVWRCDDGNMRSVFHDIRDGLDPKRSLTNRSLLADAPEQAVQWTGFTEADGMMAFMPRKLAAAIHILVVPLELIPSVDELHSGHVPLLRRMRSFGEQQVALSSNQPGIHPMSIP